jgi:hypothetical protein
MKRFKGVCFFFNDSVILLLECVTTEAAGVIGGWREKNVRNSVGGMNLKYGKST